MGVPPPPVASARIINGPLALDRPLSSQTSGLSSHDDDTDLYNSLDALDALDDLDDLDNLDNLDNLGALGAVDDDALASLRTSAKLSQSGFSTESLHSLNNSSVLDDDLQLNDDDDDDDDDDNVGDHVDVNDDVNDDVEAILTK